MKRSYRVVLFPIAVALAFAACGSKPAPEPQASPSGKKVDPATAATITGHVSFTGTPPAVESIRMTTDPACVQAAGPNVQSDTTIVSASGAVANVFVYVKDGLDPAYTFDVPTEPVVLDQKGCRYVPHVTGVRVGQPLKIINSDNTLHNVHAMPMKNQEFNQGQPMAGFTITKTFTVPEVMVKFMCNVHGWMKAYVGVLPHPFWAVTDANGAFKIAGVPPGSYTIGIWHEKFGEQEQKVTLTDEKTADLSFSFASK